MSWFAVLDAFAQAQYVWFLSASEKLQAFDRYSSSIRDELHELRSEEMDSQC